MQFATARELRALVFSIRVAVRLRRVQSLGKYVLAAGECDNRVGLAR